jgi:hypothetical protein
VQVPGHRPAFLRAALRGTTSVPPRLLRPPTPARPEAPPPRQRPVPRAPSLRPAPPLQFVSSSSLVALHPRSSDTAPASAAGLQTPPPASRLRPQPGRHAPGPSYGSAPSFQALPPAQTVTHLAPPTVPQPAGSAPIPGRHALSPSHCSAPSLQAPPQPGPPRPGSLLRLRPRPLALLLPPARAVLGCEAPLASASP